jgi:hypothetical protein
MATQGKRAVNRKRPAAKHSRATRPPRPAVDATTGQMLMFDPVTGRPTQPPTVLSPAARRRVEARERQRRQQSKAWREARRAEWLAWLDRRRKVEQSARYGLPEAASRFLARLFPEPYFGRDVSHVSIDDAAAMITAAYMDGCRQGFIEGRVADLEPKRQRSAKANAAKRRRRQDCGGRMMTLDERDAAIVAEFPALRGMLGSIEAQLRLAEKYGLQSREQVGNIVRKAKRHGPA